MTNIQGGLTYAEALSTMRAPSDAERAGVGAGLIVCPSGCHRNVAIVVEARGVGVRVDVTAEDAVALALALIGAADRLEKGDG